MAVSRALRRLLRVLTIEEEQSRLALESAVGAFRQLEHALAANASRDRSGRQLVISSARSGELTDRLAGLEETHSAKRRALALASRIAQAEAEVNACRAAFLAKRVECRQAETLIRESESKEAIVAGRRAQQGLDDWYRNRLRTCSRSQTTPPSTNASSAGIPVSDGNLSEDLPGFAPES
jgi:flagellar biosynthesis chaperone FliJ